MAAIVFDHERLRAYQEAVRFAVWVGPIVDRLPVRLSTRDQLDRASTSAVLNIAEGNGKRSHADRCRYLDIARGSVVEWAACLDVLVARKQIDAHEAAEGKNILLAVVSLVGGLIARFSDGVSEEQTLYPARARKNENENENENE